MISTDVNKTLADEKQDVCCVHADEENNEDGAVFFQALVQEEGHEQPTSKVPRML